EFRAPDNRYMISLSRLRIRKMDLRKAIFSKILEIKDIRIDAPEITLINAYHAYNDTVRQDTSKALDDLRFLGRLNALFLEKLDLDDVHFKFVKMRDSGQFEQNFEGVRLSIRDIRIDSLGRTDP